MTVAGEVAVGVASGGTVGVAVGIAVGVALGAGTGGCGGVGQGAGVRHLTAPGGHCRWYHQPRRFFLAGRDRS
ncbi:hypothetical protein [Planomonospora algeriensis]